MATSPNGTVVTGIGASINDARDNVWTIDRNGQISINGKLDATTADVDELAYNNGLVWQKNANNTWYSKSSPAAAWVQWPNAGAPVVIPNLSANEATILAGGTAPLVDAEGNVWRLTDPNGAKGYQVRVDGVVDPTTANVIDMAIVNGTIWQENTSALWYSKTTPASIWSSGTTIDPLTGIAEPVSLTWIGGGNNLASNPADWSPGVAPAPGDTLTMDTGTMNLTGNALAGDPLGIGPDVAATINTRADATLYLASPGRESSGHTDIHIASGSTLTLSGVLAGYTEVSGGTLRFTGTSTAAAFDTVISSRVAGNGTVDIVGGNHAGSILEVKWFGRYRADIRHQRARSLRCGAANRSSLGISWECRSTVRVCRLHGHHRHQRRAAQRISGAVQRLPAGRRNAICGHLGRRTCRGFEDAAKRFRRDAVYRDRRRLPTGRDREGAAAHDVGFRKYRGKSGQWIPRRNRHRLPLRAIGRQRPQQHRDTEIWSIPLDQDRNRISSGALAPLHAMPGWLCAGRRRQG
jgi:hypothetical protein